MLLFGNKLSTSATCVRKSFLQKNKLEFNEANNYITVEDYDLWMSLAKAGAKFKFLHSIQGEYTLHGDNSSANEDIHLTNNRNLLEKHVFTIQKFESDKDKLWIRINCRLLLRQSFLQLSNKEFYLSFKLGLMSFLTSPIFVVVYLGIIIRNRIYNFILSLFFKKSK